MPTSAVYQPTTVTYEQQPTDQRWNCPMNYFSRRMASNWNRALCTRYGICVGACASFFIGTVLIIVGGVRYAYAVNPEPESLDHGFAEMIAGSCMITLAMILGLIGLSSIPARIANGKEAPASGAAALTALNPSTDPLVAAQYAPVRDAPPAPDDETRNLMDNKDCLSSAEESDKMLDGRPSIA